MQLKNHGQEPPRRIWSLAGLKGGIFPWGGFLPKKRNRFFKKYGIFLCEEWWIFHARCLLKICYFTFFLAVSVLFWVGEMRKNKAKSLFYLKIFSFCCTGNSFLKNIERFEKMEKIFLNQNFLARAQQKNFFNWLLFF